MDNKTVNDATKRSREVEFEIAAQKSRVDFHKGEVESLTRQRNALKEEIKNVHAVIEQDAQIKLDGIKKEQQKLAASQVELMARQKETMDMLLTLRREKAEFESEKALSLATKETYTKMNDKVGQFVRMVKQGAETL